MSASRHVYCCAACGAESIIGEGPVAICARCEGVRPVAADQARRAYARTLAMTAPFAWFRAVGLDDRAAAAISRLALRGLSEASIAAGLNDLGVPGLKGAHWSEEDVVKILYLATQHEIPSRYTFNKLEEQQIPSPAEELQNLLDSRRDREWFEISSDEASLAAMITYRDGHAEPFIRIFDGVGSLALPSSDKHNLLHVLDVAATRAMEWLTGAAPAESDGRFSHEGLGLDAEDDGVRVFRLLVLPDYERFGASGSVSVPREMIPELRSRLAGEPEGLPAPEGVGDGTASSHEGGSVPPSEEREALAVHTSGPAAPEGPPMEAGSAQNEEPRVEPPGWISWRAFRWTYGIVVVFLVFGQMVIHEGDPTLVGLASPFVIAGPFWGFLVGLVVGIVRRLSWRQD